MNQVTFTIFNADSLGNKDIKYERYYTDNSIKQTLPEDFAILIEDETDVAAARITRLEGDFVALGPYVGDSIIGVAIVRPENPPVHSERR